MMLIKQVLAIFISNCFWFLLTSTLSYGGEADVNCLKNIRKQLQDPFDSLSTWNFSNITEGFICKFVGVDCWHNDENRVLNIKLSGMGFHGEFPRGLEECTSLTGLDLSSNELSGKIPPDIAKLVPFVTSLDLSFNDFSGEIPVNLASCSNLNTLRLDNNRFSGRIPSELALLGRIKIFSVADNLLKGPVPNFINGPKFSAESYSNNIGLCGKTLDPCQASSEDFSTSFNAGTAVGAVAFAPIGLAIGLCCLPKKAKRGRR